tara:strand:+ start:27260 stop:27400 length:141 start_codon:yes stop_codon:yes gene_type:complete
MDNESNLDYLYKKILRDQQRVDEAATLVVFSLLGGVTCIILALISN